VFSINLPASIIINFLTVSAEFNIEVPVAVTPMLQILLYIINNNYKFTDTQNFKLEATLAHLRVHK